MYTGKPRDANPAVPVIAEHLGVALAVIGLSHLVGLFVQHRFY